MVKKLKKRRKRLTMSEKAILAMREGVRKALIERKRLGISMSIWKNGKVVTIPAKKINLKELGL